MLWHACLRTSSFTRLPLLFRLRGVCCFRLWIRHVEDMVDDTPSLLCSCSDSTAQYTHINTHTHTMQTYTAEDFDIEMDELDSDAASSSMATTRSDTTTTTTTTTVKRRRRTTKKEQAILESLFEEVCISLCHSLACCRQC